MIRKTGIALAAVGLLTLTAVAPVTAQARDWNHRGWAQRGGDHRGGDHRDGHWRGGDHDGAAVGLGILGGVLAGAAIASSQAYYAPPVYYYQPPAYAYAPGYGYTGYGHGGYGYYR